MFKIIGEFHVNPNGYEYESLKTLVKENRLIGDLEGDIGSVLLLYPSETNPDSSIKVVAVDSENYYGGRDSRNKKNCSCRKKKIKVTVKSSNHNENPDKFILHLCRGCIEDLKEYNPWTVDHKDIVIIEVPTEDCDNTHINTQPWVERNRKYNLKHQIK